MLPVHNYMNGGDPKARFYPEYSRILCTFVKLDKIGIMTGFGGKGGGWGNYTKMESGRASTTRAFLYCLEVQWER